MSQFNPMPRPTSSCLRQEHGQVEMAAAIVQLHNLTGVRCLLWKDVESLHQFIPLPSTTQCPKQVLLEITQIPSTLV